MNFNKLIIWDKIIIGLLAVIFLVAFGLYSMFLYYKHWYIDIRPIFAGPIISNPDDPNFDPKKFRFQHYNQRRNNEWELSAAMLKMFPPHTQKSFVDAVLIEAAGSRSYEEKGENCDRIVVYRWPSNASLGGHMFQFCYDESNKTRTFFGGPLRYYEDEKYTIHSNWQREHMAKQLKQNGELVNSDFEERMRVLRKKYIGNENGLLE